MSSPSFLVRLRARRRQDGEVALALPQDHWHAGDPRMLQGSLALQADPLPAPRRPVDARRTLSAVPEVDVRDGVVDLRATPTSAPVGTADVQAPAAGWSRTAQMPALAPVAAWTETSTWLG